MEHTPKNLMIRAKRTSVSMGHRQKTMAEVKQLCREFHFSPTLLALLTEQDVLPQTILFYNGGAKLTCEESPTLEDLKSLEAQGVEILTCGTCLNHYGLTDKLQVGSVTNMYVIAEKMTQAGNIVKP